MPLAAPFLFKVTGRNGGTPPARDQPAPAAATAELTAALVGRHWLPGTPSAFAAAAKIAVLHRAAERQRPQKNCGRCEPRHIAQGPMQPIILLRASLKMPKPDSGRTRW
jgi:hypothetical protein